MNWWDEHGEVPWEPQVGDAVVYKPPGGEPEDGTVTEVIDDTMLRVLYAGDTTAKATRRADLWRRL